MSELRRPDMIVTNSRWAADRMGSMLNENYVCATKEAVVQRDVATVMLDGVLLRNRADADRFVRWLQSQVMPRMRD